MKSSFITPKIIKAVKKHISLKQIKKSKPKDLKIRKVVPEMEKNRRVTKAKSMSVETKSKSTSKKKSKKRISGRLGRDY